ncbi:MAG TPA: hypothetical protein DD706_24720 [Nitrospiraceae bacterium]|nr:hypothetical protein [Nitrospiraceae bacterium]
MDDYLCLSPGKIPGHDTQPLEKRTDGFEEYLDRSFSLPAKFLTGQGTIEQGSVQEMESR